jgi:SAM-dependent methyltransferase
MCLSEDIQKVMELTPTPPGNNFLEKHEIGQSEPKYPLDLYFCNLCHHLQLGHVVDPVILYQNDYSYVSGTSAQFVAHLSDFANYMMDRFELQPGGMVVDIGSNDGTCLGFFKSLGMNVLGVDPATNIADRATASGINTIADFFSLDLSKKVKQDYGSANLITSHNACAHIDDLDSVISGVQHLLADDGLFSMEVGYLYDVYTNTWFDTIYHEHLDYHSVEPLSYLFSRFDMEIISIQRIAPQGGSIRVITQKIGGKYKKDNSENELMNLEKQTGLDKPETFIDFERHINTVRDDLNILLNKIKKTGKRIAGFGAPTKATTLMNHFGIGKDHLDFIVDDNPLKQGLYTPGTHVPVFSAEAIYEEKPDYVLILAWNFSEPIMKNHNRYLTQGGKFILPMPIPKIVA